MLSLAIAVESGQSSVRVSPIGPLGCANWYTDGSYFFDGREDVIWTRNGRTAFSYDEST